MMTEANLEGLLPSTGTNVRFAGTELREKLLSSSEAEGWLPVRISMPGLQSRGRLGLLLEESIERSLESRGACPPGIGAFADSDASLSDQLYRARLLGSPGLALAIERLEAIANQAGALDAEDSAVLRWWVMTARERPLRIYFDSHAETLGVYTAPTRLGELILDAEQEGLRPSTAPPIDVQMEASLRSMQGMTWHESEAPAAVPVTEQSNPCASLDCAISQELSAQESTNSSASTGVPDSVPEQTSVANTPPPPAAITNSDRAEVAKRPPLHADAAERWRDWMRLLEQARGPKPLGVVEQLYVNAYVPLADAAARGIAAPEAFEILDTWSSSFARSYSEAFDALRLRGKRPMMVFDIVDAALRLARLHGARSVQLVLVDGLRFDLGLRVEERMRPLLGQQAAMTERLLLWSALPSTTAVQMDLLGRGPDGLKDFEPPAESSAFVAHGRAASTLRRVKTGARDVLKLDLVESRLSEPGIGSPAGLDSLADDVAETLSGALLKFAPRTLAVVFGDHGFLADSKEGGTTPARHGGSSPEEVLVPAFAWLVGATH
jgi:hypothetical protein